MQQVDEHAYEQVATRGRISTVSGCVPLQLAGRCFHVSGCSDTVFGWRVVGDSCIHHTGVFSGFPICWCSQFAISYSQHTLQSRAAQLIAFSFGFIRLGIQHWKEVPAIRRTMFNEFEGRVWNMWSSWILNLEVFKCLWKFAEVCRWWPNRSEIYVARLYKKWKCVFRIVSYGVPCLLVLGFVVRVSLIGLLSSAVMRLQVSKENLMPLDPAVDFPGFS